jgi:hypothetical protein
MNEIKEDHGIVMEVATDICGMATKQLLEGKEGYEVKNELMEQGFDEELASNIVETAEGVVKKLHHDEERKQVQMMFLYGGLAVVVGIIMSVFVNANGGNVIFFGTTIFGVITLVRALIKWSDL